jgi:AcrR family transcriptional regulator
VSVGSLYQYFPTKEALVAAVAKRHSDRMIEVFKRDLADIATRPLPDAVHAVVVRTFEAYAVDPALRRVIMHETPELGALARPHEFDAFLQQALVMYFAFHSERVRPVNMELAVRILRTAVEAIASAILVDDAQLQHNDELVAEVTWLVLRYVEK